jgi:hypothetical protein
MTRFVRIALAAALAAGGAAAVQATVQWPEDTRPRCLARPGACPLSTAPDVTRWDPVPVDRTIVRTPVPC